MPRLRPRPGVAAETVVDLARATGRYPTLLKQLAHTRTLVLIDHGASPEILKRAEHLTVTARFTTATELLPQDQPILFAM